MQVILQAQEQEHATRLSHARHCPSTEVQACYRRKVQVISQAQEPERATPLSYARHCPSTEVQACCRLKFKASRARMLGGMEPSARTLLKSSHHQRLIGSSNWQQVRRQVWNAASACHPKTLALATCLRICLAEPKSVSSLHGLPLVVHPLLKHAVWPACRHSHRHRESDHWPAPQTGCFSAEGMAWHTALLNRKEALCIQARAQAQACACCTNMRDLFSGWSNRGAPGTYPCACRHAKHAYMGAHVKAQAGKRVPQLRRIQGGWSRGGSRAECASACKHMKHAYVGAPAQAQASKHKHLRRVQGGWSRRGTRAMSVSLVATTRLSRPMGRVLSPSVRYLQPPCRPKGRVLSPSVRHLQAPCRPPAVTIGAVRHTALRCALLHGDLHSALLPLQ